jgi:phosphoribosyl 1,2-cyclic phosphodiesterase/endonuclease/exonuclease/phosphatase family metal-dependent hydrolase
MKLIFVTCTLLGVLIHDDSIGQQEQSDRSGPVRIATWNISDIWSDDLKHPDHGRLTRIARRISELKPDILVLNELAYDWPVDSLQTGGLNAKRFVTGYLAGSDLDVPAYVPVMPPVNTGLASGFDLDRSGTTVSKTPDFTGSCDDECRTRQTRDGRAYGGDAWGFGMFPGQYGLAILVSDRFRVLHEEIRTFRTFRWADLPAPLRPKIPGTDSSWYSDEAWAAFPLSSKTHVDVPVEIEPGRILHVLVSHPTPPAFDGPERRNKFRNHDELAFWKYYLDDESFIYDDRGRTGGLERSASFVVAGDLNSDPDEGSGYQNPIQSFILSHPRVNGSFVPVADRPLSGLDPDDTARWGLRADYVLPSKDLRVLDGGVDARASEDPVSDHFPVWIDVDVAPGATGRECGGGGPKLIILGIAQDAGAPQAGTKMHPGFGDLGSRVFATSLGILDPRDGSRWIIDAGPDFRDQLHMLERVHPTRDTPGIDGIFLTHAHIGHYTGLMHLGHEAMGAADVPVYAMPRLQEFLSSNGPWDQLVRYGNIELRPLKSDLAVSLAPDLSVTPFLVPHRDEYSETVGYRIEGPSTVVVFIPDIDKWETLDRFGTSIEEIVGGSDLALLDGTFFSSGEVGGRDMSSFPHPFMVETLERFEDADADVRRRIAFIHLNHTNPALDPSSEASRMLAASQFSVARQSSCVDL